MSKLLPVQNHHAANRYWKLFVLMIMTLSIVRPVFAMNPGSVQSIEEVKISLYLKDVTLQKAFLAIEKKSDFKFQIQFLLHLVIDKLVTSD